MQGSAKQAPPEQDSVVMSQSASPSHDAPEPFAEEILDGAVCTHAW
ncbi:MAG: hypothetical protein IPI35_20135 [Deltaproteobacteria bacterium]|nr:hypothetical protein [Deltaproteobacteria bacterium]